MAKLYLIPNTISEEGFSTIPSYIKAVVGSLRCFVVEEEREARRFIKKICPELPVAECTFFVMNEHSSPKECKEIFEKAGDQDFGIIPEAGCPCIADPGAELVLLAHQKNLEVIPLVGPSSILLALMASGLNGQNFAFNGYLPKEGEERIKKIKALERRSFTEDQTQIFMETPYRNQHVLEDILAHCDSQTFLCLAMGLTSPQQYIKTLSIAEWKKKGLSLPKQPALFLIYKFNK